MTSITFATSNNDPKNQNNPIQYDPIWTPMRLLDEPLDCNNEYKDLGESGIPPAPQYIVCTEDVEPSGRFLSNVLEGGCFLGTIKNQTTLKAALSKIDNDFGNLYIVGHSDKNAGYICKGKVLISKCLSLAKSKVKTIIFLMCYSSEIAERSYINFSMNSIHFSRHVDGNGFVVVVLQCYFNGSGTTGTVGGLQ